MRRQQMEAAGCGRDEDAGVWCARSCMVPTMCRPPCLTGLRDGEIAAAIPLYTFPPSSWSPHQTSSPCAPPAAAVHTPPSMVWIAGK